MKFCLSSRQSKQYLEKADEIKVDFRDRNSIPDLAIDYPDKTIILVQSLNSTSLKRSEQSVSNRRHHRHLGLER